MWTTSHRHIEARPAAANGMSGAARIGMVLCILGVATLVCAAVARGDADARRIVPLYLPEANTAKPPRAHQHAAFASKLRRGYGLAENTADEFAGWILEASVRQRLAPELLASVIMAESSFRKRARSSVGAIGPAQVRAELWRGFCGGELEDPQQNLYCGAQILAHYHEACALHGATDDAESCALRSYNVGFGNRNNVYFVEAAARYTAKIDRYRGSLTEELDA